MSAFDALSLLYSYVKPWDYAQAEQRRVIKLWKGWLGKWHSGGPGVDFSERRRLHKYLGDLLDAEEASWNLDVVELMRAKICEVSK